MCECEVIVSKIREELGRMVKDHQEKLLVETAQMKARPEWMTDEEWFKTMQKRFQRVLERQARLSELLDIQLFIENEMDAR